MKLIGLISEPPINKLAKGDLWLDVENKFLSGNEVASVYLDPFLAGARKPRSRSRLIGKRVEVEGFIAQSCFLADSLKILKAQEDETR